MVERLLRIIEMCWLCFFFSSRRRHTRFDCDWSSDVCSSDLSGRSPDGKFVEIAELPEHPWYLAVQFHPEFKSKPTHPHPLFAAFVGAALQHKAGLVGQVGQVVTARPARPL